MEHHLKEIVQARLLARLFASSLKGEMALKGGLAMRALTGSARYTKDIDLMAPPDVPLARVRKRIIDAVRDLEATGVVRSLKLTAPKQTDTTQRWKIEGHVGGTVMHLTIEVSRRAPLPEGHVVAATWRVPPDAGVGPVMIESIDLPALAAAKVACLGSGMREAPRDLWDLAVLIDLGVEPAEDLMAKFTREEIRQFQDVLWDKVQKMDWATAQANLLPYVEPGAASRLDEATWDDLRLKVASKVEKWLAKEAERRDGTPPAGP